jgi:hypothetical protein
MTIKTTVYQAYKVWCWLSGLCNGFSCGVQDVFLGLHLAQVVLNALNGGFNAVLIFILWQIILRDKG